MAPAMDTFLLGGIAALSLAAATFFFRFFRDTRDPLFAFFGAAFALEALNRTALVLAGNPREAAPLFYVLRALSYTLILLAIWLKNRR
jgi:hypothetical protein